MADVFNKTPAEFIDINTMFDVLNNRVGFEAEQLRAIVENTYWLYNYALEYHIPADNAMSDTSTNAVQNKVIKLYIDGAVVSLQQNISNLGDQYSSLSSKVDGFEVRLDQFDNWGYSFQEALSTLESRINTAELDIDNLQASSSNYATSENLNAVAGRVDTLESAIGDIGTLLDTINGEVV